MDDSSPPPSVLLCQESDRTFLFEEAPEEDIFSQLKNHSVVEDDDVKMLAAKEITFWLETNKSLVLSQEIEYARLESIAWILKTRAEFGFLFQTAYLSVTYLDRFLSRRSIDKEKLWAIKLVSVACLSLAAKMEEVNVPSLTEYQFDDYNFGSSVIQRMELLVLNSLHWRMRSVTPLDFLHYFITKFHKDDSPPDNVLSEAVALILAAMRNINLMEHRPSITALAATLVVLGPGLSRKALECRLNSLSCREFLNFEDVFACYIMVQKLDMEKLYMPKPANSPDLSPTQLRKNSPSAVSSKRKRLTFEDGNSDQSIDRPDEKRLG